MVELPHLHFIAVFSIKNEGTQSQMKIICVAKLGYSVLEGGLEKLGAVALAPMVLK